MDKPTTVDTYLAGFSGPARELLHQVVALIGRTVPSAAEAIKWGCPAWVHPSGTILFALSGHKAHANIVFTPSTREAFAPELSAYDTGKGSVKLPYGKPVPEELLARMMAYRVREHEEDGVKWM
ncbi:iron chaperone [Streptomyces indicus]|uniref:Uncharacterized conserved protein YdhG, YjbR/CyaY-like superfamily, DUF1801 family n=1 Tax=Streptomyces indicus TaxID=417292 RepID=A0A1G8U4E9_9ACTN|nr:DUF1801 domain-containing protein [Streptomyces indicus]SDJ48648.1 Uncharacterized conserved protein YdhG, YjbR/CyaY-like superfamily, DUF1801 family [Streptomyces indicus]